MKVTDHINQSDKTLVSFEIFDKYDDTTLLEKEKELFSKYYPTIEIPTNREEILDALNKKKQEITGS
jgi:hypothetical protein